MKRLFIALLLLSAGIAVATWYSRTSSDVSPDSIAGYGFAIVGTGFIILAGVLYTRRRHSHKARAVGQLNASLQWHMYFAVIGLVFLFLHAFGNFNPRTGTYALYGMIALAVSGVIGRLLDRFMPRMIAGEVQKALTVQGEDRIESISERLQAIVVHNNADILGFSANNPQGKADRPMSLISLPGTPLAQYPSVPFKDRSLHTPWDIAYISLEETPQELSREAGHYRFVPDKKSALARPGALMPGAQQHLDEMREVEQAMQREQFYRYIIRYWRAFHILLALVAVGLTLWHLVYAAQLLIPVLMHH